jgi:phosphoglycolate phosphatase-like HAD superfamily hydrolase
MRRVLAALLLFALASFAFAPGDPLPSWNDTATKKAILDFVDDLTEESSANFVDPEERIATFDNDGTLWVEQPLYVEFQFSIDRVKALAPQHPEWTTTEPFNHVLAGDLKGFLAGGEKSIVAVIAATHSGLTPAQFEAVAKDWLAAAKHPRFGRVPTSLIYQPMLELLAYLRDNRFKTFIVSGGGVDFMRAFAQTTYGVPPEQVIGSYGKLRFELLDGKPELMKLPDVQFVDNNAGKPIAIAQYIGHRPNAAFGNSDGDLQMLQWTAAGPGRRFVFFVHHDDAVREYAYDRHSSIGRLDVGLTEAKAKGWTIVSMKDDWKTIFPHE